MILVRVEAVRNTKNAVVDEIVKYETLNDIPIYGVMAMGRFLNPGNELFRESVNSEIYIDKTDILEFLNRQINTRSKYICVSRPRRFGKSMTADKIAAYYDISCHSKKLFDELKISSSESYDKYINQHHVILLDIQWFRSNTLCSGSIDNIISNIQESVIEELREHFGECIYNRNITCEEIRG